MPNCQKIEAHLELKKIKPRSYKAVLIFKKVRSC